MTPSEDVSIAAASPSELAKYLKDKQLKSFSNFSEIELEDKAIPGTLNFLLARVC
jgi:hypothetical protein